MKQAFDLVNQLYSLIRIQRDIWQRKPGNGRTNADRIRDSPATKGNFTICGSGGSGAGPSGVTPPFGMILDFLAVGQVAVGMVAEYGAGQLGEDLL